MKKEEYERMTDEELIALFREGDQDAMEELLIKYKAMVLRKAIASF